MAELVGQIVVMAGCGHLIVWDYMAMVEIAPGRCSGCGSQQSGSSSSKQRIAWKKEAA